LLLAYHCTLNEKDAVIWAWEKTLKGIT